MSPVARRLLVALPIAGFVALALLLYFGLGRNPSLVPSAMIGKPAPEFDLPPLLPDQPALTRASLAGKPVLVNFFASWCVPCRVEHKQLTQISRSGIVPVYGIAYKDKPDDSRAWLAELGNPYAAIGVDESGRASIDWGVYGVPETYLLDGAGTILFRHVGPLTDEAWRTSFLPLLARQNSAN